MKPFTDKEYLIKWKEYCDNVRNATPIDINETFEQKQSRIKRLEANDEEWFKYYFPNFYYAAPALFHLKATKRVMNKPEWFEVRAWSRELAKSARTMMEILKLSLTGKKKNILLVSNSSDNAIRLLMPYKVHLEANNRITNDYGAQKGLGTWEAGEFITRGGVSFRAVGAGQSPRGNRNNEARTDTILIDDIDTDEECRNPEIIYQKFKWIEEALIPTRSISKPLLIIVCGNIIADYCCVTELIKKADHTDIINIRDKTGKSSWAKNTEAQIKRIEDTISYDAFQKEYMNNPMTKGKIFQNVAFAKCPLLHKAESVTVYADPATSNKTESQSSEKCVAIVIRHEGKYYVHKIWLDRMTNAHFIDALFEAYKLLLDAEIATFKMWIENNSLQDPFYQQVLLPLIEEQSKRTGLVLPLYPDDRPKTDKYSRIEATLEPLNRNGHFYLNEKEEKNPHFERLKAQLLACNPKSKRLDGPDAIQGAVAKDQQSIRQTQYTFTSQPRASRKY